jgi:hypothetical protein
VTFLPKARTDCGAFFLDDGALVGDGFGGTNISNELFDYSTHISY